MTVGLLSFGTAATVLSPDAFQQLKIGAGGFITGIDIASDGTMVCRTDTYGAYKWNGASWDLIVNILSMPAGEAGHSAAGDSLASGVYEIVIAPSNTARFYMVFNGKVYRTDDSGGTWALTNFTAVANCDPNGAGKINATKLAVDPNNADICLFGTPDNGLWKTIDAGANWAQISTAQVPVATTSAGGIVVCFDTAVASTIYASVHGHGVYVSTDGGSNWTLTTSSPTTNSKMINRAGVLWHIDGSSQLRKYTGSWSAALPTDGSSGASSTRNTGVDVDPANSSRIVAIIDSGTISVSLDAGSTWCGFFGSGGATGMTRSAGAGEPAWLAWTNEDYMSAGNIHFNPAGSNELWFAEGICPWVSNPPDTAQANAWNAKAQGIEQLVANGVISPPGGVPLVYSWDRPIFRVASPTAYPATHGPNRTLAIVQGGSADWASADPTCIVLLANIGNSDQSSKSADGGQTWSLFPALPGGGLIGTNPGGMIAAASNQNFVWIGAQDDIRIWYTTDGGTSWAQGSITGPISGAGFSHNANIDRQVLCADRVDANTFYLYYNGSGNSDGAGTNADGAIAGIYKSVDGGATWTKVGPTGVGVSNHRFGNSGSANIDWGMGFFAAKLRSVPNLGSVNTAGHLFFTCSDVGGSVAGPLYRSTDGGATWSMISNTLECLDVGFGAPAPGQNYPTVFIAGWVGGVTEGNYGIYRSIDNCLTWEKLATYPNNNFDFVKCISGDSNDYKKVYVGFIGSGWAYGNFA